MSAKKQAVKKPAKKAAAKVANKTAKKSAPNVPAVPALGKLDKTKSITGDSSKACVIPPVPKIAKVKRVSADTNKPAPLRANHGSLPGDVIQNGVCYPRPNTKKLEMWNLIEKVQGKSNECPERFKVMEAMHDANEKREDGKKFKTYSFALEYHWYRTFHGVAGDRVKLYKKRGPKSNDQGELPLADKPVKAHKVPAAPKAKKAATKTAKPVLVPPVPKVATKTKVKVPAIPPVPPVPQIPELSA